ncbi:MAG: beta-ketoacyl synthase N-terminal-like domain-containing protein, partial [Vicinamibacteria bacterium]
MSETKIVNGIAIVGLDVRVPGASQAAEFWRNLRDGVESIVLLSDEELERRGIPVALRRSKHFVPAVAVPEGFEEFDAAFFGFSPREAEAMDPQLRIFLESAWAALESAGYDTSRYRGAIGIAAGVGGSDYFLHNVQPNRSKLKGLDGLQIKLSNASDSLATMTSYKLDLGGPSFTVQTACSSSLVAVHLACQSLLNGECDVMLAGGVTLGGSAGYLYQEGGILSRDGHCRAFDASASGTVPGSGVGVVVLKRLEDALRDGDTVRAVILGSAVGNDGAKKGGYTAPSVMGHARVVTEALAVAGVAADSIGCIEAHGTGTEVGDPIEIEGLTAAFREATERTGFCAIGSVKSNIGHLDHAAGVVSLIKCVLALENQAIPPSLHFAKPNPKIDFESSPFYVARELSEWPDSMKPRRVGVSSLGIGGTNAHVILEEAPPIERVDDSTGEPELLLISARTESALDEASARLAVHLREHPELSLADVAFTLQSGRRRFAVSRTLVARSVSEAASLLESRSFEAGSLDIPGENREGKPRRVPLPTYPFERQRYWLDPLKERPSAATTVSAVTKIGSPREWLYLPAFRACAMPRPQFSTAERHRFLFLDDESPMSRLVASRLADLGHEIVEVRAGGEFRSFADGRYVLRPDESGDYRRLVADLQAKERSPD